MSVKKIITKYDYDLLDGFCKENKITLAKDYGAEKINRNTIIEGKCIQEGCCDMFNKNFRQLYEVNGYCVLHTLQRKKEKIKKTCLEKYGGHPLTNEDIQNKIKETCLEKYGVERPAQNENIQNKMKETCLEKYGGHQFKNEDTQKKIKKTLLERYGVEHFSRNEEIKNKIKETCLEKYGGHPLQNEHIKKQKKETCLKIYGVEYPIQHEDIKNKIKQTCLRKYGVECPFQNEEIKTKNKQTFLKKYGVEFPSQNNEIKKQKIETSLKHYGVEYPIQHEDIKNKTKATCIKKYGVEYPFQNEDVKNKIKETCIKKYGVPYPSQNENIVSKILQSSYSYKDYILPSEKIIKYQGYENFALDELIKNQNIPEEDIINGCDSVPTIWYEDENKKKHRHYVDIFIPSQNKCIEVKSTWTIERKKDNIFFKQIAGKKLGHEYEIWIYNAKGERVECHK